MGIMANIRYRCFFNLDGGGVGVGDIYANGSAMDKDKSGANS